MSNAAKNFDFLGTGLSIQHNYFKKLLFWFVSCQNFKSFSKTIPLLLSSV